MIPFYFMRLSKEEITELLSCFVVLQMSWGLKGPQAARLHCVPSFLSDRLNHWCDSEMLQAIRQDGARTKGP